MFTMILISSAAVLVALVGCVVIWGYDAFRAEEISHESDRLGRDARQAPAVTQARTTRSIPGASSTR